MNYKLGHSSITIHLKKEIQIACNTNIGCTNVDIFFTFVSEFEENATL